MQDRKEGKIERQNRDYKQKMQYKIFHPLSHTKTNKIIKKILPQFKKLQP